MGNTTWTADRHYVNWLKNEYDRATTPEDKRLLRHYLDELTDPESRSVQRKEGVSVNRWW